MFVSWPRPVSTIRVLRVAAAMSDSTGGGPSPQRGGVLRGVSATDWDTRMGQFADYAGKRWHRCFDSYSQLWAWSVSESEQFWQSVIDFFDLHIEDVPDLLLQGQFPAVRWLAGAGLNYAEHMLRSTGPGAAVLEFSQSRPESTISRDELRNRVAACAAGLRRLGVARGDRVAAYMPNITETVVLFLAAASMGAVFASCPPEFGIRAAVDRLAVFAPKVLVATNGYVYGTREIDRTAAVAQIVAALPSVQTVVTHRYLEVAEDDAATFDGPAAATWAQLTVEPAVLEFESVPFAHPLYLLSSSGSTGLPKAIVHGHGGILLEHAKALGLHNDVGDGDRFFWYATTGWMVWNYAVSALGHGAALVCFDGNPNFPDVAELWRLADRADVTFLGTSAAHVSASSAAGVRPRSLGRLSSLRAVASTGSALPAAGFEWLSENLGAAVRVSSVSGGTEVCSGFVGGAPLAPTRAGELSAPMLGCDVAVLDERGAAVRNTFGELCVRAPMPSMPVCFLDDADGSRYRAAYFQKFPGVWAHGDWALQFDDGAFVIAGRSDATLNRGGVRLGTADIYGVIDGTAGIDDSVVVHLEAQDGGAGTLVLILSGAPYADDGARIVEDIKSELREQLSPRHVPDVAVWVPRLPRTLTGKRLEKPIKQLLQGADPATVATAEALSDPAAFSELAKWAATFRLARDR